MVTRKDYLYLGYVAVLLVIVFPNVPMIVEQGEEEGSSGYNVVFQAGTKGVLKGVENSFVAGLLSPEEEKERSHDASSQRTASMKFTQPPPAAMESTGARQAIERLKVTVLDEMPSFGNSRKLLLTIIHKGQNIEREINELPILVDVLNGKYENILLSVVLRHEYYSFTKGQVKEDTVIGKPTKVDILKAKDAELDLNIPVISQMDGDKERNFIRLNIRLFDPLRSTSVWPSTLPVDTESNTVYGRLFYNEEENLSEWVVPSAGSMTYALIWCNVGDKRTIAVQRTDRDQNIGVYHEDMFLLAAAADDGASLNIQLIGPPPQKRYECFVFAASGEEDAAEDFFTLFEKYILSALQNRGAPLSHGQKAEILDWTAKAMGVVTRE